MDFSDSRSSRVNPWWEDDELRRGRDSSVSTTRSSHKKKNEKTPRSDTYRLKKIGHFPFVNEAHYNLAKWKRAAVLPKGTKGIDFIGVKHNSEVAFFTAIPSFTPHDGTTTRGGWKLYAISFAITAVSVQITQYGAQCSHEPPRRWGWENEDYWK